MKTKNNKKEYLILQCRYYNGERYNECAEQLMNHEIPGTWNSHLGDYQYDLPWEQVEELKDKSLFWMWEQQWVSYHLEGTTDPFTSVHTYKVFVGVDFEASDATPLSLKAFVFGRFCSMMMRSDTPYLVVDSFKEFYKTKYTKEKTHLEKRAAERRPVLIKKCKYYCGEETNPWEFCYAVRLVQRRKYWQLEKEWVDALSFSYECQWTQHNKIKEWHLEEFFKATQIPLSLVELIITNEIKGAQKKRKKLVASEIVSTIEQYSFYAPVGHGPEKYFAYFNLEKKNPYDKIPHEKSFAGLFWLQEGIIYRGLQVNPDFINGFMVNPEKCLKDGVNGWMHDEKYPSEQRSIWLFIGTNYLTWCPYGGDDIEPMGDEYLNFHYVNPRKKSRKKTTK